MADTPTHRLEIQGRDPVDVADGTRLVLAIRDAGVDIGHRCGGIAKCTTCRVRFSAGEPEAMTEAERAKLEEKDLLGDARLSCQILVDRDMAVEVLMRGSEHDWADTGPEPAPVIEPEPTWS
jgi:ferredoxin